MIFIQRDTVTLIQTYILSVLTLIKRVTLTQSQEDNLTLTQTDALSVLTLTLKTISPKLREMPYACVCVSTLLAFSSPSPSVLKILSTS